MGPRYGRYVEENGKRVVIDYVPYDSMTATAGTWILMYGLMNYLISFSILNGAEFDTNTIRVVIMAVISMSASVMGATILMVVSHGRAVYSLPLVNNALLGGLVAICAGAATCNSLGAFFIGLGSGVIALLGPNIPVWLGIDDPRDVFTVHFLQAIWGLFSIGLWANDEYTTKNGSETNHFGAFYSGNGVLLGYQLVYILTVVIATFIITWFTLIFAGVLGKCIGRAKGDPIATGDKDLHEVTTSFPYLEPE